MKELIPMNEFGVFADIHDTPRVDSRFVAQFFEKRPDHVLRDVENLIAPTFGEIEESVSGLSQAFIKRNFALSSYKDNRGRSQKAYAMTRDGFTMLVMGYTGQKAMRFKEQYIRRFNEMEQFIETLVSAREQFPKLTRNIRLLHENPKPYHYSNECDMINRIVLGMTAKQFRESLGLEKGKSIRPYLRDDQIAMLELLQDVDIGLLLSMPDFQQRKRQLEWYATTIAGEFGTTRRSVACLEERDVS